MSPTSSSCEGAREHNLAHRRASRSRSDRWSCSPACRARASRRSRSTRSTPRASAATSSRCRRTRASSSARWRSRSTSSSAACRRPSRSSRRAASSNPRSTVGTITEIYDYLRVLYARAGEQRCHQCGGAVDGALGGGDRRRAADAAGEDAASRCSRRKAENRKGEFRELFDEARKAGFVRVRIDGMIAAARGRRRRSTRRRSTRSSSWSTASPSTPATAPASPTPSRPRCARAAAGRCWSPSRARARARAYSEARACPNCGIGFPELSPQSFSFNSPLGMCVECNGLGSRMEVDPDLVVPDPSLSIRDGAIAPWGDSRRHATAAGRRTSSSRCATRVRHRPRQAVEEADAAQREVLLYGTGDKRVKVDVGGQARRPARGRCASRASSTQLERRLPRDVVGATRQRYEQLLPRAGLPRAATARACAPSRARCCSAGKSLVAGHRDDRRRGVRALRRR